MRPKIFLVFFDAGGGHRSAARALEETIRRQERPWDVTLLNLQEALDSLDIFRGLTGVRLQDLYNLLLRRGWTLGFRHMLPLLRGFISFFRPSAIRLLIRHFSETRPDLVVSLIPHFNSILCESLRQACPGAAFVTILTDLADYPPRFWMEKQDQHIICGTEKAVEQARAAGFGPRQIHRASGMILHPRFYQPVKASRRMAREQLGLDPARPTGLVMFGGVGSPVMLEIARSLDGAPLQLIFICGRNERLQQKLRAHPFRIPVVVLGFTEEIPYYMHVSDFFIGKPGPGSISEALKMGLPVIVESNDWTVPQERYNALWIVEHQYGIVIPNFRKIHAAVFQLLRPSNWEPFLASVGKFENRAVLEIPDVLAQILDRSQAPAAMPARRDKIRS